MTELRAKVNRLELWGRSKDVVELLEDQAADHRKDKDSKLFCARGPRRSPRGRQEQKTRWRGVRRKGNGWGQRVAAPKT